MRLQALVRATCRACGRQARFAPGDLIAFHGAGMEVSFLRFRCRGCGSRNVEVRGELDLSRPDIGKVKPRPTLPPDRHEGG